MEGEVELCASDQIQTFAKSKSLWDFWFSQCLRMAGAAAKCTAKFLMQKTHLQGTGDVHRM